MLFSPSDVAHSYLNESPSILVHVGASAAEESKHYGLVGRGLTKTVWIEADPAFAEELLQKTSGLDHHQVVSTVVWDETGLEVDFFKRVTANQVRCTGCGTIWWFISK